MTKDFCVCGHMREKHFGLCTYTDVGFSEDGHRGIWRCVCQRFKLDNLKLIEDVAKKRNLI